VTIHGGAPFPEFNIDNPKIILSKERKAELADISSKMESLQQKKIDLLREIGREQGIIASSLEELKSTNGQPFVEKKSTERYRNASVTSGNVKMFPGIEIEHAYLCPGTEGLDNGCGWVKGVPKRKEYNDIGALSGSSGINFHCRICGSQIAQIVLMRS